MWKVTVRKTVTSGNEEVRYVFVAAAMTKERAVTLARIYASMVEYGTDVQKWKPRELSFLRENLFQFVQPALLNHLEEMYPDVVATAHSSAIAYVQSYIGGMFDVEAMLDAGGTTTMELTLRLALTISTAIFILSSAPNMSEVIHSHRMDLNRLLRGLRSGQRTLGSGAKVGNPDVRLEVVELSTGQTKP